MLDSNQSNRIGLDIPPRLGMIVAETIVVKAGFLIKPLTRKPQVELEIHAVLVWVLIGQMESKRLPGVPLSHLHPVVVLNDDGRAELVAGDAVNFVIAASA